MAVWISVDDVLDLDIMMSYHGTAVSAKTTGACGVDGRTETCQRVESFIVGLLAKDLKQDEAELRAELTDAGPEMPYDSVLLVELMTRVEKQFGVRLEPSLQTARDMRSVRSFAERVCDELDLADSRRAAPTPGSTEGCDGNER